MMGNSDFNSADIEVVKTLSGDATTDFINRQDDLYMYFLHILEEPAISVAVYADDGQVTLYYGSGNSVMSLHVDEPTESGAMTEYTPVQAVQAMLQELGVTCTESGELCCGSDFNTVLSRLPVPNDKDIEELHTLDDVITALEDSFTDLGWE